VSDKRGCLIGLGIRFYPHADFRPIRYEDIALEHDVVFLVESFHHDPENVGIGAPEIETRSYTGMVRNRNGDHFELAYFSMTTDAVVMHRDGYTLADPGGRCYNNMTFNEKNMKFWKMGELYAEQGEATKTAER
jgi:hypothetical protein